MGFPEKLFKNVLKDILTLTDFALKKMFCGTTRATNIFFLILSICTNLCYIGYKPLTGYFSSSITSFPADTSINTLSGSAFFIASSNSHRLWI